MNPDPDKAMADGMRDCFNARTYRCPECQKPLDKITEHTLLCEVHGVCGRDEAVMW